MGSRSGTRTGSLAVKVVLAALVAAIGATLAADVASPFLGRSLRAALTAGGVGIALISAVWAAVSQWRGERAEAHREEAAFKLRALAWALHDVTGIDVRDLGLALYALRRDRLAPWRRHLRRISYERSRRLVTSEVRWRPGKGVIGLCVEAGEIVGQDVGADEEPWLDVDRGTWEREAPPHVKSGLGWDEWQAERGKYHVVVAAPVVALGATRGQVLGCVAVDGPPGSYAGLLSEAAGQAMESTSADLERFVL